MKRITIILGLLLSLFVHVFSDVIIFEASMPGINENGGIGDENGDGNNNGWGWNSIDQEKEEF